MKTKSILITTLVAALLIAALNFLLGGGSAVWQHFYLYVIYSAVFATANALYFKAVGRWFDWHQQPEKTLIISILGVIPVNIIIYFGLNLFFRVFVYGQPFEQFIAHINPTEYIIVVFFALIIALFIITGYSFKAVREAELKAEQLKTENERSKFESLKNQLDPHFLFNNLNVLTALIGENPKEAEHFSLQLADVYKYVLEQKEHDTVPLKTEMTFAKKILNLYQMRFENGIRYEIPALLPESAKIPPLSLQIVLENCIKHNHISTENPLFIKIEIKDNYLIISNNKTIKSQLKRKGFGLQNIEKRYALLNTDLPEIKEDKDNFIIKLPLL